MSIGAIHLSFFQFKNDFPILQQGRRPTAYSQISEGHRVFLDAIAKERGYLHYKEAEGFHPSARRALEDMVNAAKAGQITLAAFATYRPYDQQVSYFFSNNPNHHKIIQKIWGPDAPEEELKEIKRQYLARAEVVAPPGYSKHHTGLVVDLNSDKEDYWGSETGQKAFAWLKQNAERFGYRLSYPGTQGSGAILEKWEWQYVGNPQNGYPKVDIKDYELPYVLKKISRR